MREKLKFLETEGPVAVLVAHPVPAHPLDEEAKVPVKPMEPIVTPVRVVDPEIVVPALGVGVLAGTTQDPKVSAKAE